MQPLRFGRSSADARGRLVRTSCSFPYETASAASHHACCSSDNEVRCGVVPKGEGYELDTTTRQSVSLCHIGTSYIATHKVKGHGPASKVAPLAYWDALTLT